MTSHRRIALTGLIAVALPVAMPSLAAGSSLLSGYGGPGQGSQAILGSALLGGGAGTGAGGGGSTSGGAGGSSGPLRLGEQPGRTGSSAGAAAGTGGAPARKAGGGASASRQAGAGRTSGAGGSPASSAEPASDAGTGRSETLGLSGDDLVYVLLALAALAFTGVLTRRLARAKGPDESNC